MTLSQGPQGTVGFLRSLTQHRRQNNTLAKRPLELTLSVGVENVDNMETPRD
jgi:hypothetical protein